MYSQIVIVWYLKLYLKRKKKKSAVFTKHIESGVGWNKNICKLSCEIFWKNCILCHKINICCYKLDFFVCCPCKKRLLMALLRDILASVISRFVEYVHKRGEKKKKKKGLQYFELETYATKCISNAMSWWDVLFTDGWNKKVIPTRHEVGVICLWRPRVSSGSQICVLWKKKTILVPRNEYPIKVFFFHFPLLFIFVELWKV